MFLSVFIGWVSGRTLNPKDAYLEQVLRSLHLIEVEGIIAKKKWKKKIKNKLG